MSATTELALRIDALLPQTQCTRCGYPACRDYAEAVARGDADIDRCPPGGADGVAALAALLGRATKPLDPACGVERAPLVAVIDEAACIGCTKCIRACPVDAIVGAAKRMHTVIASECTGCELCLPPCPVDCIALVAVADRPLSRTHVLERASLARRRYEARRTRRSEAHSAAPSRGEAAATAVPAAAKETGAAAGNPKPTAAPISRAAVLEAIARGKARRHAGGASDR